MGEDASARDALARGRAASLRPPPRLMGLARMRMNPATCLTVLGAALGVAGLLAWPSGWAVALLVASLIADAGDGALARRLGCETAVGARLDWSVDVAIAFSLAWVALPPWSAAATTALLVALHTAAVPFSVRGAAHNVSGRALVTMTVLLWWA